MHELSIVLEIQKCVERAAKENHLALSAVASVVVEVGEVSSVIPRYLTECWPVATEGTEMEGCGLEIEMIPAEVRCKKCGAVYEYLKNGRRCPACGAVECVIVRGEEFNVKEIVVNESDGAAGEDEAPPGV